MFTGKIMERFPILLVKPLPGENAEEFAERTAQLLETAGIFNADGSSNLDGETARGLFEEMKHARRQGSPDGEPAGSPTPPEARRAPLTAREEKLRQASLELAGKEARDGLARLADAEKVHLSARSPEDEERFQDCLKMMTAEAYAGLEAQSRRATTPAELESFLGLPPGTIKEG
jgi:hypothetical protein